MATSTTKTICSFCDKLKFTYCCPGCSQQFCFEDLAKHRTIIQQEFDHLQNSHDLLRQQINDLRTDPTKHPFIKQIDRWESDSIKKIREKAQQCRTKWLEYSTVFLQRTGNKLNDLAQQIQTIQHENEFNEVDLNRLREKLQKLEENLNQPANVSIKEKSTSFINKIFLPLLLEKNIRWKSSPVTITGGNGPGNQIDQLNFPCGMFVDDENRLIYIADVDNHRIVEWRLDANCGRVVAGGNGQGNQLDQLNRPTDVIIDRKGTHLIITDKGNRRVMRWSRQSNSPPQVLIDHIDCSRLAMHADGTLYVSDSMKHEVRRWKIGETQGTVVAGGNGQGNRLDQLNCPTFLFVDSEYNLYISDSDNHRVIKWMKNANEGIVVAGGNGSGDQPTRLACPQGLLVDHFGQIYVADCRNHCVMRWCEGERKGIVLIDRSSRGEQTNQLNGPFGLSFDGKGNLFVADCWNHRVAKFRRDFD